MRRSKSQGNNGPFYVSTFKGKCSDDNLLKIFERSPLLVIDDKIRICTTKEKFICFMNSFLPFRYSPYENEYQKFLRISPKFFLAIEYYLDSSDPNIKKKLITLKQLIMWADSINNDIQFINSFNSEIISKDKVKKYINI